MGTLTREPRRRVRARPGRPGAAPTPPAPYADRLARLAAALAPARARHVLVTNPADVGYLTGFLGGDSVLLAGPAGTRPVIISDFRYQEELDPLTRWCRVHIRSGAMPAAVAQVIAESRARRVAIQGDHMTAGERDDLARRVPACVLVAVSGLLAELRRRKDAGELALIRRAVRIQEAALLAVLPTIRPGQSELEIAARLEFEMKSRGSSAPAFETIVAARASSSRPHYRPGRVRTSRGGLLLIDWGATVGGYRSDMTRTFALGSWPRAMRDVYAVVLDAHRAAAAALRPGVSNRAVDAVARGIIARAGHGERFGHGLGHGIGCAIHEQPRLGHNVPEAPLAEGDVVTIEPGVYLPGVGGVRLENDYEVTARGSRCLCSLPLDRAWATL